jgi:DNA-binding CsgD family transcriptional regulator
MRERTLENAQVHLLATRYDLARESRLGREIARTVNAELDAEEGRRGIERVRSGELYVRTSRGSLRLPLRTQEALDRVLAGERWPEVRRDLLAECERRYRTLFPNASSRALERFRRTLWPGFSPRAPKGQPSPLHGARRERPWGTLQAQETRPLLELDQERGRRRLERGTPRSAHQPRTMQKLQHYLGTDCGIPPAVQEPLLLELMAVRARFYPRMGALRTGQMPLAAMHVDSGRQLWTPTRHQPLAPVVVSVLAGREGHTLRYRPPTSYKGFLRFHARRLARALTEAYVQDGLLSFAELQWIFLLSTGTVSRAVDHYQRTHGVLLPCPGTVLDMGRMLTHKDIIVRLSLQGHSVLEIARKTYHNPRSVDAYLRDFDAVLILHIYGLSLSLMARVVGKGESLIDEYLFLIGEYLNDPADMRRYLQSKGVPVPALVSHGG